jgi:hypothetical protein
MYMWVARIEYMGAPSLFSGRRHTEIPSSSEILLSLKPQISAIILRHHIGDVYNFVNSHTFKISLVVYMHGWSSQLEASALDPRILEFAIR